jgi:hypothetical protein
MEPLRVTFRLRSPLALGFPWISLDSLLLHVKLREELGEKYYSLPTKIPARVVEEFELPIKRWHDVYVASVSLIDGRPVLPGEFRVFSYFKRGDFPFTRGKVRRGSGFFKDFYLRQPYVPAGSVVFYCTGERGEVERLARLVPALGKDRNIGFGLVREVAVEEWGEECGVACGGLAMRPIPVKYLRRIEEATLLAYKPPYWARESVALCAVPFTRVELAE